jgi:hypothetical protein
LAFFGAKQGKSSPLRRGAKTHDSIGRQWFSQFVQVKPSEAKTPFINFESGAFNHSATLPFDYKLFTPKTGASFLHCAPFCTPQAKITRHL